MANIIKCFKRTITGNCTDVCPDVNEICLEQMRRQMTAIKEATADVKKDLAEVRKLLKESKSQYYDE